MYYQYRFTLDGTGGPKSISEPEGWVDIELNLERETDNGYWSLVENFESPFAFYGSDGIHDGGYSYVRDVRDLGPDYVITILIEISTDNGDTFTTLFDGLVTGLVELEGEKKIQFGIIRNDLWSKFFNRKETPINVRSTTTLDGTAITACATQTIDLPSQEIFQRYTALHATSYDYFIPVNAFGVISFDNETINEIKTQYDYPNIESDTEPFEMFAMDFDGVYDFDVRVTVTDPATETNQVTNLNVIFRINQDSAIFFTMTNLGINGVNGRTQFTYTATHTLNKGDQVRIYFDVTSGGGTTFRWYTGGTDFITVEANTTFKDTSTVALFPHDIFRALTGRMVDDSEPFYSEFLGGSDSQSVDYDDEGCGSYYGLMLGAHIRTYSITNKPFSMSFDDVWEGMDKIFNLGLGYETVTFDSDSGTQTKEVIRIEQKSYFFDDSDTSIELVGVNDIEEEYDESVLIKNLKIGYKKWQDESYLGIDDPQTQHNYSTRFKTLGKSLDLFSNFVAASLVIEQGRRKSETLLEDWKFDDDTFILHLDSGRDDPRLYSSSLVSNLINDDTRYNIRLTPKSNLNRWNDFISIGLAPYYPSETIRFNGGQGNTKTIYNDPAASGCDLALGTFVDEDANLTVTQNYLFTPLLFKFSHKLNYQQYKAIVDNRKKSISVGYIDNAGINKTAICFIKKLGFKINEDIGNFECWVKTIDEDGDPYNVSVNLSESIGGDVLYLVVFSNNEGSNTQVSVEGDGDSNAGSLDSSGNTVHLSIQRNSSPANAADDGMFEILVNSVLVHTIPFLTGADLTETTYDLTGLTNGDSIQVNITEG